METIPNKSTSTSLEESIKSEERVRSPAGSDRSDGGSSPPPNCSICLGKLINKCFTDNCLHQFCFTCLLQWSKIKTECPLCKQTFKSIIHNVRSEEDYDQYHVQYTSHVATALDLHVLGDSSHRFDRLLRQWQVRFDTFFQRSPRRSTMYQNNMLGPHSASHRPISPPPTVSAAEMRERAHNPIEYRRSIYRSGVWSAELPIAFGRSNDLSADYYRRCPSEVTRLIPWLNRELQALLNNNRPHVSYVLSVILDTLTQYDIHSLEFQRVVRRYLGYNTELFIHEFWNFARTSYDIVEYDLLVSYMPQRGLSDSFVDRAVSPTPSTSSSSDDSDVRVLASTITARPYINDIAGPSTVAQALRINASNAEPSVLLISSSSESENECEVIGYVKPRHERTPELINLLSSDEEIEDGEITADQQPKPLPIEPMPGTSQDNQIVHNENINHNGQLDIFNPIVTSRSSISSGTSSINNRRTRNHAEDKLKAQVYEYLNTSSSNDSSANDSDYNPMRSSKTSRKHKSKKSSKKCSKKSRKSNGKRTKSTGSRSKRMFLSSSSEDECEENHHNKRRHSSSDKEEKCTKRKKSKRSSKTSKKSYREDSHTPPPPSMDRYSSYESLYDSDKEEKSKRRKTERSHTPPQLPTEQYSSCDSPFTSESRPNNERNHGRPDSDSSSDDEISSHRRKIYRKIKRRRSRS